MVLTEFEDVNDDAYDSDVKVINPFLASSIRCDPRTFARRGSCVANRSDPRRVKVVFGSQGSKRWTLQQLGFHDHLLCVLR